MEFKEIAGIIGALIGVIGSIIGIAYFVIKAFIKQSEKTNVSSELIGNRANEYLSKIETIYKETSERHINLNERMINVIERNNNLINNNNKGFEKMEEAVKELKDITMKSLLKARGE